VIDGEFESDFRLFGIERDPALEVLIVFRVAAFFRRLFRPRRDAFLAAMRFRMSPFPFRVAPGFGRVQQKEPKPEAFRGQGHLRS
jgi:hypothetical protein